MKTATIYSIAETLGVSPSTVSRAFSRPEMVKPEVRERILGTARELGYSPNRAARGLATGRTGVIGMLVPDVENPFFPPLIRAVQVAARAQDAELLLIDSDLSATAEHDLVGRIRLQVDGLIIASPRLTVPQLDDVLAGIPAVIVNRPASALPTVVCDNTSALQEIADHLHGLGHRRMALLRGPREAWAAEYRAEAVRSWAAGRDVEVIELGPFEAQFEHGRDAADQVLSAEATAVFAFDDLMAAGVVSHLNDHGRSVPVDLSVVGCDDVLLARTMTPSLTTVAAPFDAMGRAAVDALGKLLAGRPAESLVLPGTAVLRESVGTIPSR